MRNKYKKIESRISGITLISLVISVIVLIILASVGIYSGISAINSSKLTRFTTQMKLMQLEVNELYTAYTTGGSIKTKDGNEYIGNAIATIGKDLNQAEQEQLESIFKTEEENGSGILNREGYRYFDIETIKNLEIEGIDEEFLINIEKRSIISYEGLKYDDKIYYTLEQVPDSLYNVDYENPNTGKPTFNLRYEKLESGKWKIIVSDIRFEGEEQGFINKWQVKYQYADTQEPDKWNISENLEFIVNVADEYRVVVFQQGVESESKTIKISKAYIYKDSESNKEAYIPEGFKVSEEPTEQKIDTGLVVIAPDGSEFVWVPVDKTTLCVDGAEDKEVAEMANEIDYRGVLYDFSGTKSSKKIYDEGLYREPDIVEDYDNEPTYLEEMNLILGTNFINLGDFKEYMQKEYNAIIESIKTKGGFYIGRYESSLSDSTNAEAKTEGDIQSKGNIMPTDASNIGTYRWYGLYAKQHEYATVINSKYQTNVKSAMIYGSMYDAVMNWALYGDDKTEADKVTKPSKDRGSKQATKTLPEDKLKNIYDLGNNLREWTAEAYKTNYRIRRGRWLWRSLSSFWSYL